MSEDQIKCPYRRVCPNCCPGDDDGDGKGKGDNGNWLPILGFILREEGMLCLDWEILIDKQALPKGLEEGQILRRSPLDALKEIKRLAAQNRYEKSEKGKRTWDKHIKGVKFKLSQQKYYYSDKGQIAHKRAYEEKRQVKRLADWLKNNPGKGIKEFETEIRKSKGVETSG